MEARCFINSTEQADDLTFVLMSRLMLAMAMRTKKPSNRADVIRSKVWQFTGQSRVQQVIVPSQNYGS
ncbi:hypothetical protein MPL1_06667 [Methylophaga lonarensis MPL]|uniref:Uncharacterized protein n=1 Tax=Methylophaga lonarensis MPL TaxID=1286106 RepID=M7PRV0_9GAMM|nr:hypothetical protein MPL1_06667 [Methylophaga lonarensis MPL]